MSFRPCVVIPTYNNPATIAKVVNEARTFVTDVIVVDDGSGTAGREATAALANGGIAQVIHRAANGGKGAAVKTGIAAAAQQGFTHVLQVDADGQHNLADVPRFLEQARAQPEALILGEPRFDATAPKARLWGRKLTNFWVHIETAGRVIADPMCGFRVYPVAAAMAVLPRAQRMDFDPEVAVRLVWQGLRVVNVPTSVRYLSAAEGGVSHFQMGRDNLRISWMHTRLVFGALVRLLTGRKLRSEAWRALRG
ncbi:MAG: glycosyltransferase family 2 protein [Deltaproteobacteria bacterium]|nr:glycosyltransferase family 2 protein [Deltaproteobacteria bacterium]